MDLDAKVCYCFHVTRRKLVNFVRRRKPKVPSQLSECGGAGTGCGWCIPFLKQIHAQVDADLEMLTPEEYALTALDHDGKDVWKCPLGRYISQHGSATSPVVVGDVVLIGNDQEGPHSSLYGIHRDTGKIAWEKDRASAATGGMSAITPVLMKNTDDSVQAVFCSRYEGIAGIDPQSGKMVWQMKDAFKKLLDPSRLVIIEAGDFKKKE